MVFLSSADNLLIIMKFQTIWIKIRPDAQRVCKVQQHTNIRGHKNIIITRATVDGTPSQIPTFYL